MGGSFLPVVTPPPSPPRQKNHGIWSLRVLTLCAVSAAFAACTTSLLCVLILNNSNSHNVFGNNQEPTQVDLYRAVHDTNKGVHHRTRRTTAVSPESFRRETPDGVAWLMTFPNSGTSYTIELVREITKTTTATNYGHEGDVKDEESVPVFQHLENAEEGPFLVNVPGRTFNTPKLILTKTHCGSYCSQCTKAETFIETTRSFTRGCLQGKRVAPSDVKGSEELTTVKVQYSPDLVKKVVHIFRNPLDNVVARFHLDRKVRARTDPYWLDDFPNNKEGFRSWCSYLNANRVDRLPATYQLDSTLIKAMKGVPCITEFYLYVQWHNLAFVTTSDLQVPSFVFHYEDYSTRFDDVTDELTEFLGLKKVAEAPEFIAGKTYGDYYTEKEKHAIALFIKEFATKPTWQNVEHYLTDFLSPPEKEIKVISFEQ